MKILLAKSWLVLAVLALPCLAAESWMPVRDVTLTVEPGSILDFSDLIPPKAIEHGLIVTPDGHFARQDQPSRPLRFLMASTGFSAATGSFPDHAMADLYARQLRMHGYNMARLDFVEETLMTERRADFDFNPEQRDRLHYLLAALKREGIYYVLNGLSSGNAAYGDVKERWVDRYHAKLGVYYDRAQQAHWKQLMEKLYASVNPYTGLTTLRDPALAGLIMVNEGGLAFMTRQGVPDTLQPLFADWLRRKYGTTSRLAAAWQGELRSNESLEAKNVAFPRPDQWAGMRMGDTQQFFVDLEKTTAAWMTQHLRQLGYHGLVTAYDNWLSPAAHVSRGQFEWVDLHNYFAEPTAYVMPGSTMRQDSMLEGGAKYIRELATGRHVGKAFTVSEYGQVFWNKYRRESGLAVPAYAAFQGWDMICQHAGAIELSYASVGGRKDAIYPFVLGLDPVARAGETLAALLFLRGDVMPARHLVGIKIGPQFAFYDNPHLGNIPDDISRMALVTGVGLDWQAHMESGGKYDAQVEPGSLGLKLTGKAGMGSVGESGRGLVAKVDAFARKYAGNLAAQAGKTTVVANGRWASRADALRKAGLINGDNATDPEKGIYQSDTGQLMLDSRNKSLAVVTPATEAVVFDTPERTALDNLVVEQADGPALVSVSAMDGQPLKTSRHMLVILATDARNSGMRFSDAAETTLQALGKNPVQIRMAVVKLKLRSQNKEVLKVFSTTLRGKRGDVIPVMQEADGISFVLDTARLSHGPTTFFEITAQE